MDAGIQASVNAFSDSMDLKCLMLVPQIEFDNESEGIYRPASEKTAL